MTVYVCEKGHEFLWVRKGWETKPEKCELCGSKKIEVRDI